MVLEALTLLRPGPIHKSVGNHLTELSLPEILSDQNPERDESQLRMVSLFLWEQGRFRRFLRLIADDDRRGYPSYFEAAMELPLERIIPLWQDYLLDVERRRDAILSLPLSAIFENEEAFQSFARDGLRHALVQIEPGYSPDSWTIGNIAAGAAPAVFTEAEILISAAEKLVPKAEIGISAWEIDISAAQITISRAEIIVSRL